MKADINLIKKAENEKEKVIFLDTSLKRYLYDVGVVRSTSRKTLSLEQLNLKKV